MKAGIMEVADVLVVNKADLPGADTLLGQLQAMTALASRGRLETPVLATVATKGEGVVALAGAIEEHRRRLAASGALERERLARARRQVLSLVRHRLLEELVAATERDGQLDEVVGAVARRELDPYAAAQRLVRAASGRED
jgi:LAO/AO transport system kinase